MNTKLSDRMPVLVGTGQITRRDEPLETCSSPVDLIVDSANIASKDTGVGPNLLKQLDALVLVRCLRESFRNSPRLVADRIGAHPVRCQLSPYGGNLPQYLVNYFSEAIASGKHELVMLGGAEAMDNQIRLAKANRKPNWAVEEDSDFEYFMPYQHLSSRTEHKHGLSTPASCYPMFETALRNHYGNDIEEHQVKIARLFSGFSRVAAGTSTAWYPTERSAETIMHSTPQNRYVGWPYTKYMNAMNNVNQGAVLILASVGRARKLGVPPDKWVYLHGCGDANDTTYLTERLNYHSSPSIRKVSEVAFEQAGFSLSDIDFLDIYSCFPVAVQVACDELGMRADDTRSLTVTGGLPYHGGPSNSYVMHSIATMVNILRENSGKKGMITANGGYLTKHSVGLYSTEPAPVAGSEVPWQRRNPADYQAEIDGLPYPEAQMHPQGKARIEAYTILFDRNNQPTQGLVLGRLENDRRFCAKTAEGEDLVAWTREEMVGATGVVTTDSETELSSFSAA